MNELQLQLLVAWQDKRRLDEEEMGILIDALIAQVEDLRERAAGDDL